MKNNNGNPLLVGRMANLARSYAQGWLANKARLQKVVHLLTSMDIATLDTEGLYLLLTDAESYIFDLSSGGSLEVAGTDGRQVTMDKAMAASLYQKPAGYEALLTAIAAHNKECMQSWDADARYSPADVKKYFRIEEGALQFSVAQQGRIDDAGNCYSHTEKGKAIYRFLEKLSAAFIEEGLDKLCLSSYSNIENRLPDVLMPLLNDTFRGIDRKTKKPIVEMQGTATNASFAGDRL